MAKVQITEFNAGSVAGMQTVKWPNLTSQTVAVAAGSTQSTAFGLDTRLIRVNTDVICSIAIGVNPTATVDSARMAANQTEYFEVIGGHKLATIANT
jgi:hypothetical protein